MNCVSSMELIFLILVFFVKGLLETEAVRVTGKQGEEVTVTCSHSNAFGNIKYFCRGACRNEDVLISSREKKNPNSKYSIKDDGNVFHVTIFDLTDDDSGTYWCGIERTGLDTYNEVVLTVKESQTDTSSQKSLVYITVPGVVVFCLLVIIIFVALVRCQRRHIQTSSGKAHEDKQSSQKPEAPFVDTSSTTANEDEETDVWRKGISQQQGTSRDHTDNPNVTVSSAVQMRPEGLLYSTVSFNKHKVCSAAEAPPTDVVYATLAH